jgi:nucleoside diphosphate kinase
LSDEIFGATLPPPPSSAILWLRQPSYTVSTLAIVKCDGLPYLGRCLSALERHQLKIHEAELVVLSIEVARTLYAASTAQFPGGPTLQSEHVRHLCSRRGCFVAKVEGTDAVGMWHRMVGAPVPAEAKKANAFSLRGSYGGSEVENRFHGKKTD